NTVTKDATSNRDPALCLRKLNPDPAARIDWHPPFNSVTHTAVAIPGKPYVLVGDERNGTTTCPWSWYRVIDISSEVNPKIGGGAVWIPGQPGCVGLELPGGEGRAHLFQRHAQWPVCSPVHGAARRRSPDERGLLGGFYDPPPVRVHVPRSRDEFTRLRV